MPVYRTMTVEFGTTGAGATVTYQLYNADGSALTGPFGGAISGAATEIPASSGNFGIRVTRPAAWRGFVEFAAALVGGGTATALWAINPEEDSYAGAEPGSKRAEANTIYADGSGGLVYLVRMMDGSDSPADVATIGTAAVASGVVSLAGLGTLPSTFAVGKLITATVQSPHADLSSADVAITAVNNSAGTLSYTATGSPADMSATAVTGVVTTAVALLEVPAGEREIAGGTPIAVDTNGRVQVQVGTAAGQLSATGGRVQVDGTQAIPTTGNTANTLADCLNAARAQGFGKWVLSGTSLQLFAADGTTVVKTFTLDSSTAPTSRT